MNTASLRRRGYSKKDELIEHPDCYCFVFETTEEETTIGITYYLGDFVDWVQVDDNARVRPSVTANTFSVKVPSGVHTIYIHPYRTYSHRTIRFNGSGTEHMLYIRFPYNASTITLANQAPHVYSSSDVWDIIDVLDTNVVSWINSNPGYNTYTERTKAFRVPKGCKQKYIDAGFPDSILSKMTEYNFKYEIPE